MTRVAAALILLAIVAVIVIVVSKEHRVAGYAMPLLVTSAPKREAPALFAPCPITPRNFLRNPERKA